MGGYRDETEVIYRLNKKALPIMAGPFYCSVHSNVGMDPILRSPVSLGTVLVPISRASTPCVVGGSMGICFENRDVLVALAVCGSFWFKTW